MQILALGGSLREASKNRALLVEAAAMAPGDTELDLSQLAIIGSLPRFNQDILDRDGFPAGVAAAEGCAARSGRPADRDPGVQLGDSPGFLKNGRRLGVAPGERHPGCLRRFAGRAHRRWRRRWDALCAKRVVVGVPLPQDAALVWPIALRRARPGALRRVQPSDRRGDSRQLRALITGFAGHCAQLPRRPPE